MKYEIKVLEPTDLWYVQNNINKETNKFYHPTNNIPFVQQVEINLNNSGVIDSKRCAALVYGKIDRKHPGYKPPDSSVQK